MSEINSWYCSRVVYYAEVGRRRNWKEEQPNWLFSTTSPLLSTSVTTDQWLIFTNLNFSALLIGVNNQDV